MRKPIIAANWKMNHTVQEAVSFLENFTLEVENERDVEIVIVPAFTALAKVGELVVNTQNIRTGAQNMYFERSGAFTGEISAAMLRELYVRYVVLGHSERRAIFGESDALIQKKVKAAHEAALRPILCVGETLPEREAGEVEVVLARQLSEVLDGLSAKEIADTVIAYEPVWAIGTGKTATPEQAQEAHAFIRSKIASLTDAATADKVRIQYGGSVKPSNAEAILGQPDVDGALVGGASLDARDFAAIVKAAGEVADR